MKNFYSKFSKLDLPLHGVRLPDFQIEPRLKKEYGLKEDSTNYDFLLQVCRKNFKNFDMLCPSTCTFV